jgi:hypothetical protein
LQLLHGALLLLLQMMMTLSRPHRPLLLLLLLLPEQPVLQQLLLPGHQLLLGWTLWLLILLQSMLAALWLLHGKLLADARSCCISLPNLPHPILLLLLLLLLCFVLLLCQHHEGQSAQVAPSRVAHHVNLARISSIALSPPTSTMTISMLSINSCRICHTWAHLGTPLCSITLPNSFPVQ